jgi:beta-lactam-binding protein with PASTA domain
LSDAIHTNYGEREMKVLRTKMLVSSLLLATLAVAETAYAQTPNARDLPNAYRDGAPATANDSWESGVAGARVRVQRDDAIEDGRVVGQDPDPNIRSQLQREYNEGGDGD